MSKLLELRAAKSRGDLAKLLHTSLAGMTAILYAPRAAHRYTTFAIPKKSGDLRIIKAPDEKLKLLQKKLSELLQDCLDEIHNATNAPDNIAHGFRRNRSIITNAKKHRNRRWVFNIDLQDFFPSIHFGRVQGYFLKDRKFQLHPEVATTIAQIACDGKALPQGSPCSPVISNLVAHILDIHIVRLAGAAGCTYSRYADDLTFSTNKRDFPPEIAVRSNDNPHVWLPGTQLNAIISHANFSVNTGKTRMQYRSSRQDVTGLVVNLKVNIRREYRHAVRAMVHTLFSTGSFQVHGPVTNNGVKVLEMRNGTLDELHGRLGFIDSVDLYNKKIQPRDRASAVVSKKEGMYRQFLIYRDFYTAELPVILCEGKTDNVYIKHAIRKLAHQFPLLARLDDKGNTSMQVRLYKYAQSSTGRILGLKDGGTSHLNKFIGSYKKEIERFNAPGLRHPLIILFDNDSGADPIGNAIRSASGNTQRFNRDAPFIHIVKNLYAVPIPRNGKSDCKIENLFDAKTRGKVLDGKKFTTENEYDPSKYYGKAVFAEKVIAQHANEINFSGFIPLLENISFAIQEHARHF